jgi:protein transport protein SEC24
VAIDTFLFSGQYTDLTTLSVLSKYTSGNTYYYPAFYGPRDGVKFEKELRRCLTRATAFEAVMRVRATRGMRITNFYGNYFVRGTDLLALPNCTSDSTFALDLAYDEAVLAAQVITVQAALLYTNSNGERRIRVHTMVLPVTQVRTYIRTFVLTSLHTHTCSLNGYTVRTHTHTLRWSCEVDDAYHL